MIVLTTDMETFTSIDEIATFDFPVLISRQNSLDSLDDSLDSFGGSLDSFGDSLDSFDDSLEDSFEEKSSAPGMYSRPNSLMYTANIYNVTFDGSVDNIIRQRLTDPFYARCSCPGTTCTQIYTRISKYPRIIEPSTKLGHRHMVGKVQIRIPYQLQVHIGYQSCKLKYKALTCFITFIQIQSGFLPISGIVQKFVTPSPNDYMRARDIIITLGLKQHFYTDIWAPKFQKRFTESCSGLDHIKKCIRKFFNLSTSKEGFEELQVSITNIHEVPTEQARIEVRTEVRTEQTEVRNYIQNWNQANPNFCIKNQLQLCSDVYSSHIYSVLNNSNINNLQKITVCNRILYNALTTVEL